MIRFPWRRRFDPRESRSPHDGGISRTAARLSQLVNEYRAESVRWSEPKPANELWADAWTLDAVRTDVITGAMSPDDGMQWAIAGRTVLDAFQLERSRKDHPSGRFR